MKGFVLVRGRFQQKRLRTARSRELLADRGKRVLYLVYLHLGNSLYTGAFTMHEGSSNIRALST